LFRNLPRTAFGPSGVKLLGSGKSPRLALVRGSGAILSSLEGLAEGNNFEAALFSLFVAAYLSEAFFFLFTS